MVVVKSEFKHMWPVLFQWGQFELRTTSIFLMLALFTSGFVMWRKCREEHYLEDELFDGFLLAVVVGLITARIGFIFLRFELFGFDPIKWLDIWGSPGLETVLGLLAATWYIYRFARKHKWDAFEILDFWSIAVCAGMVFVSIGLFFNGTGFGVQTTLPWGMVFPGVFAKHHPLQLYQTLFFALLGFYLVRIEYKYRMFAWYRAGKNTAQTGFLVSVGILIASIWHLGMSFISLGYVIAGVRVDQVVAASGVVLGIVLLYRRSGRTLGLSRSRPRQLPWLKPKDE